MENITQNKHSNNNKNQTSVLLAAVLAAMAIAAVAAPTFVTAIQEAHALMPKGDGGTDGGGGGTTVGPGCSTCHPQKDGGT